MEIKKRLTKFFLYLTKNLNVMMNKYKFLIVAFAGLLAVSCANDTQEELVQEEIQTEESCLYSYNSEESKIGFTAYKFLNRTGVGGGFNDFVITGGEESDNALDVIRSLSFEIPISGLDTKDKSRDGKITTFFFDEINTELISGKVVSIDDAGNATIEITMNGITGNVDGKYTLEGEDFSFEAEIDVLNWDAQAGIDALNEECYELHIDFANGETESKLWSEVTLNFSTKLNKICD